MARRVARRPADVSSRILIGDARARLAELDDRSVQTCVTSPPYFGLRDYGTGDDWAGGDPDCEHVQPFVPRAQRAGSGSRVAAGGPSNDAQDRGRHTYRDVCGRCGAVRGTWEGGDDPTCDHVKGELRTGLGLAAWSAEHARGGAHKAGTTEPIRYRDRCDRCGARRVGDRQIGLEETPEQYVHELVTVMREVRRVLRDDGTLWLNLGDSYATGAGKVGDRPGGGKQGDDWRERAPMTPANRLPLPGLKAKDLIGIPWLVAFALRADGWYLRSDIVWAKPNPMPESITRPADEGARVRVPADEVGRGTSTTPTRSASSTRANRWHRNRRAPAT